MWSHIANDQDAGSEQIQYPDQGVFSIIITEDGSTRIWIWWQEVGQMSCFTALCINLCLVEVQTHLLGHGAVTFLLTRSCIATTWACLCQVWRGREAQSRSRKGLFKNVERWACTLVWASIRKTLIRTIDPYWVAVAREETCGSICPDLTKTLQVTPALLQCCTVLRSYRGFPQLISWYAHFSCIGMSESEKQFRMLACFNISCSTLLNLLFLLVITNF